MKSFSTLVVFLLVVSIICGLNKSTVKAENYDNKTTKAETQTQKEQPVKPNGLRSACAYIWGRYYKKEKIEIHVSTRGTYDETAVFTCPDCSLEEHFVNPFLNSEYQGKTGMDRLRECGFTQAAFKGGRGLLEIVKKVPKVKANPMRSTCADSWNTYYENKKSGINVSTRGEYQETVVFTCPKCNMGSQFVNSFLNTEHEGKTGMNSIKECGFAEVVFQGGGGMEEMVIEVP
ncbi:MAG: hypothetical protein HYW01_12795 [Deltaproteobacteria bacterium]|nr:hypothetical protein [Deltaproteobacteria bacterium]